ncbi:MAG: glycosyltransferase family 2 protein [Pseudomonadota bacterium]|jgi:glycosyltransferase involved in cell wall biosynthesis|nr:glycosyltransferase family 2 protein [Pseudomonadota bacterium]MDE3142120.1 glycosyltransferase family 2 protein [Pseudomonadota bacterium]
MPEQHRTDALWVVVPMYNEVEVLPEFQARLTRVLDALDLPARVLYVDDGSRDASWALAQEFARRDARVHGLKLSRNFGKETALTAGLDAVARAGNVAACVVIDADLQDPPEVIPELIARWREGADMVYATRRRRLGESGIKRLTAALFYRLMRRLSATAVPQDTGDFRLLSARALRALAGLRERQRFMKGLFAWIGYPQAQVLYDRAPRAAGTTKWNYGRLWRFAVEGITSFSTMPLRLATWVGVLTSLLAFAYGAWIVLKVFVWGISVPGYASLIVAILFLGGMQLLALGIIGEYVGRTYLEVKQRPLYLIEASLGADAPPATDTTA